MPLTTTDIDPQYNALVENDAGAGGDFPWDHGQAHGHQILTPTQGAPGGGGTGGVASQALVHADGPNFDTNATVNGTYYIPPDNASAAGKSEILVAVNGVVQGFDRSGADGDTLISHPAFALDDVFKSAGAAFSGGAFDPHVLYDPNTDRFIVVAVDQNSTAQTSHVLVAVSNNSSPHSGADFHAVSIDATQAVSGGGSWADFPQIGLDTSGHIYITANMFTFSGGSYSGTRLWVEKEGALSTAPGAVDVAAASGAGADDFFSAAPTFMPSANGNFLISYNSATNAAGHNVLYVTHVSPNGSVGPEQTIDLGSHFDASPQFGGIGAPQPGSHQTIDADDSRASMAVLGNHLYVAATTVASSGPDAGHATAHWWGLNVNTGNGAVSLYDQGAVSGNAFAAGSNLRTYYPSVAVGVGANGQDELAINFSSSAPQTGSNYDGYASAYEVTFDPSQTAVGPWHLLAGGEASYVRTFGTHDNRWGDYSSISTDPLHTDQYWAFNEFAMTQGTKLMGETGRWGTELGLFA